MQKAACRPSSAFPPAPLGRMRRPGGRLSRARGDLRPAPGRP
ncbi:hypothetical protein PY32053_00881 [Paracoccus yeei]|uniref:Uncharacterized protein n=1 Tax=Paracoccus yeei TaxID=147645 RepID=A0A386UIM5_9RHOB|nr:hypothetical protein PY32053_00881 [Paracoccus yeei]